MAIAAIEGVIWMIVVGFIIAFILSFALGANDAANSLGTSVGAKVLTLAQAFAIGCFFETLGAVLVGSKVSDTIRKGIFDVDMYDGNEKLLMVGQISALTACAIWLFIATALKLPVSATHSIVGATVGYHLVVFGGKGIKISEIVSIVVSWFISPALSGIISVVTFLILRYSFVNKDEPLEPGLRTLPFWYALVFLVNSFSIFYEGPALLHLDELPIWGSLIICFGGGLIVALFIWFVVVPYLRKNINEKEELVENEEKLESEEESQSIFKNGQENSNYNSIDKTEFASDGQYDKLHESSKEVEDKSYELTSSQETEDKSAPNSKNTTGCLHVAEKGLLDLSDKIIGPPPSGPVAKDHPHVVKLCSPLQILSAMFSAFAHGGNDVSNGIGPLVALWMIFTTGEVAQEEETPLWILFYGGVGISVGLCLLGKRVIETIGEDLTTLTPSSGFSVELGAATTVLVASNLGIPISTTHCKVGSVVAVGWARDRRAGAVNWKLFGNIILSWVVTLPCTIGLSAGVMALLRMTV
ncbi:sodium-dependent phosphate transporter 1-B-like [Amphiura filiformis]|uniref:sodium-dependent phosphate transporter 1-B-like n=1 Tax=Amphiura filiformis TaxID=82378 RepID=UPI003B2101B6